MLESFRLLFALLNYREKRSFVVLVAVVLVEACMEMAAIGLIPLFITSIAFPEYIEQHAALGPMLGRFGLLDVGRDSFIIWGSALLLFFFIVKAGYSVFAAYWKARFAQNRALKFSIRLFSAYLRAPYSFHLTHNSAELFRNVNIECAGLTGRVLLPMLELITQGTILLGVCVVVSLIVPPVALIWLAFFLLMGFTGPLLLQRRGKRLALEAQQQRGAVVRVINEGLGGVKEIKLMRRGQLFTDRLGATLGRVMAIQRIHLVIKRTIPSLVEALGVVGLLGITVMLIRQGGEPQQLVATLSVFAVAMARMKGALRTVMVAHSELRHNSPSMAVVYNGLHSLEPAQLLNDGSDDTLEPMPFAREIQLQNLSFTYPNGDRQALMSIELEIKKGEAIGFVGATGSGKSTLVDILMGIVEPQSGSVLVDGVDIHGRLSAWHQHLGYVPQSLFLLDASVRANIALGLEPQAIDPQKLRQAVAAAELDEFVANLTHGLDTVIGERGVRISGGERQRIAIARALYLNPDVLLMDEATSALDNTTEAAVVTAVEALKGERTILIVAHRLTTVRRCDRIVFLKDGRIDAVGTYEELASTHPEFQRMLLT